LVVRLAWRSTEQAHYLSLTTLATQSGELPLPRAR
jgi:hypothetical protein